MARRSAQSPGQAGPHYDIALTEAAAGIYLGAMPAIGAGTYQFIVYERAGVAPAITDTPS